MYDLMIVGGGPAGATLARLLGNKYNILLLEKRDYTKNHLPSNQKCCGGLIAPDAQKMLATLGLGIPKSILIDPQIFAVRTIDIQNMIERFYQRNYLNIDREKFNYWLLSLIPENVDIGTGCKYHSHRNEKGYMTVKFLYRNKEFTEKTKILIGADGGYSKIRREGFSHHQMPKKYVAIQEWFENKEDMPYYGAIFDREITDFYSWTIPKENHIILGTAIEMSQTTKGKFHLLKEKLKTHGFHFGKGIRKNSSILLRPVSTKQLCIGNSHIALIGEAAGFISPSSAEGISYALKSALQLAKALKVDLEGFSHRYKKETKSIKRNIYLKNLKCPAMYHAFLRKRIMKSGLKCLSIYK